jgi:hypothetical protein
MDPVATFVMNRLHQLRARSLRKMKKVPAETKRQHQKLQPAHASKATAQFPLARRAVAADGRVASLLFRSGLDPADPEGNSGDQDAVESVPAPVGGGESLGEACDRQLFLPEPPEQRK